MCKDLIKVEKSETVTGFKFVVRDSKDRFVSPVTGIIYKVGKIPAQSSINKRRMKALSKRMFMGWIYPEEGSSNYEPKMKGLTGLFSTARQARISASYPKYQIIQIKGRKVATGTFYHVDIDLIDEIYEIAAVQL